MKKEKFEAFINLLENKEIGAKLYNAPERLEEKIMEKVLSAETEFSWNHNIRRMFKYLIPSAVSTAVVLFAFVFYLTGKASVPVTFRLSYENANRVSLVGDFNDWQDNKIFLRKKNSHWEVTIKLEPQRYQYMFVIDGQKMVFDPEAQTYVNDGFGHKNSVVDVTRI